MPTNAAQSRRTLVFGGARSGKSAYAEQQALAAARSGAGEIVCIATADRNASAADAEMAARIAHHRQRREALGSRWRTVEEPLALGQALRANAGPGKVVLVDCLTVWLSNLLFAEGHAFPELGPIAAPAAFALQREDFLGALQEAQGTVILVSNEVGMGIVPIGAVSRWFVDEAGRLNQSVAAICERVQWVAAGLPLSFKDASC
ncbi:MULTISPECIES: bifunctional adenosylcobinamide kinase/adenosylcobinamide-phosphate guanylyltransferase [unclassified Herbaspirillum]|uniref:bifunctional adenosylcobinamide kinase/adenosylcobinamide-phosphate guanylyltransferase n=1 Tax=unclassified Herbaspirillum TaxID=2624150 RepID=UPI0017AB885A|nr:MULTISPECIES: bifunctional adenosylcobinamide kinase/adenosylcobinamide-phosphate guanylyltransferase [unclassified Herbaspirillum]MBB5393424.1 adenosylcobinamide kinase/adenosylcobinamide-phosphate guanylyltransferase [Herbaspirillum sp. SJZ102]